MPKLRSLLIVLFASLTSCGTTEETPYAGGESSDVGTEDLAAPMCPSPEEVRAAAVQAYVGAQVPCADKVPEGGLVECQGVIWRAHPALSDSPWENAHDSVCESYGGDDECLSDDDCLGRVSGHCINGSFDGDCECWYGCRCDAECPEGQVCADGACYVANCGTNADCGEYACALSDGNFEKPAFHCQSPNDTCRTDADCGELLGCDKCLFYADKWQCMDDCHGD